MEASTIRPDCMFICRAAACFLLFFALSLSSVFAADRETEMFTKGYEYLFSFKPDKAAQTFREFLKEFPRSPARDAAQFWLGKALIALESYAEAEQMFLDIQQDFPESPFLPFIDNELAEIAEARSSVTGKDTRKSSPAENVRSGTEQKTAEEDRRIAQVLYERDKLLFEAEKLRTEKNSTEMAADRPREQPGNLDQQQHARDSLLLKISELEQQVWQKDAELAEAKRIQENIRREAEQERKTADSLRADVSRLSQVELIFKELWRSYEEVISDADQHSDLLREHKITGNNEQPEISTSLPQFAGQSTEGAQSRLPHQESQLPFAADPVQTEVLFIRGKAYTFPQIIHSVAASEHALEKLGIQEPVWRTGNPLDDFINELLLSEEAAKSGAIPDEKEYRERVSHYNLDADEADYLKKLMIIGSFIGKTYMDAASELFIEILTVDYTDDTSSQNTVTATDLQKAARSGISFEEIQKTHRDSIKFSRLHVDEFTARYKDKSQIIGKLNFLTEETAVMWSEKGYMVIKPLASRKQFDPFIVITQEEEEEIRSFLSGYIAELRENM